MADEKYKVIIYPAAENDLREIKKYFETKLYISANKFLAKLNKEFDLLESFPFAFPMVRDTYLAQLGYRMIPVDSYIVFYVVKGKKVQIHRIIYGKRNYYDLLK